MRADKSVNDCDRLAASPLDMDRARPPGTGVVTDKLDAEAAIDACNKAVNQNPRVARYLYNLGRAYQKLAMRPGLGDDERRRALDSARLAYDDAANRRGYISALNDLAVLDELDNQFAQAIDLFKRGAQQGHPLAMYNLALHYRDGVGVPRDDGQAAEWFARSAGSGLVSAMVEYGRALWTGRGQADSRSNPRRAVEWLQRAAEAGSLRAMYWLGWIYQRQGSALDAQLALLWYGRAAEGGLQRRPGEGGADHGKGRRPPQSAAGNRRTLLAARRPSRRCICAGRICRQAAQRSPAGQGGVRRERGRHAPEAGYEPGLGARGGRTCANLSKGELGEEKNPIKAMEFAYDAIDLAVLADPTAADGDPYYEFNAAHLLVEMAKDGEAVDAMGRPLLTPEEIDRLEHYYGAVDPTTKHIKLRGFKMPIFCEPSETWYFPEQIWVWDWGRSEAPTEFQIRYLERLTGCPYNVDLRATLIDIYSQAKKSKVAFADLLAQRMQTLEGQAKAAQRRPQWPPTSALIVPLAML